MIRLFRAFLFVSATYLSSCQHGGVVMKEVPMGLSEIRRGVIAIIGEPRKISSNGYQLTSVYYDRKEKPLEHPNQAKERYSTLVSVLGDRRPYDIRVQVFVEIKTPAGYETVGQDDVMADKWAERIRKALHESRDKRNFVDDFKVF